MEKDHILILDFQKYDILSLGGKMENQINVSDQNTKQIGQNPVNQATQISEKPKINYLIAGLAVSVCFILFGFGGYYLGKQSEQTQNTTAINNAVLPTPSVTNSPTPQTKPENTKVDWKTYTNTKYGFSFKYPRAWIMMTDGTTCLDDNLHITGSCDLYFESYAYKIPQPDGTFLGTNPNAPKGFIAFLSIYENPEKLSIRDFIFQEIRWGHFVKQTDISEKVIGENRFTVVLSSGGADTKTIVPNYFIANNNLVIDLSGYLFLGDKMNVEEKDSFGEIFNQILSTFMFLN